MAIFEGKNRILQAQATRGVADKAFSCLIHSRPPPGRPFEQSLKHLAAYTQRRKTLRIAGLDFTTTSVFVLNGLKREELIAANSMRLHEAYFDSLGGPGGDSKGELATALERDFGSVRRWREEFVAMGKALGGGSGWVLLTRSGRDGRLLNQWAADHAHALAGATPILALDMYEHSCHMDYGAKAGAYVDVFMENIQWERVAAKFSTAD